MLDDEKAYVARCEAALRRMLDGARLNVVIGERVAGDRYSAERLGRHLKSLAKELERSPEARRSSAASTSARTPPPATTAPSATTSAGGTSPATWGSSRW